MIFVGSSLTFFFISYFSDFGELQMIAQVEFVIWVYKNICFSEIFLYISISENIFEICWIIKNVAKYYKYLIWSNFAFFRILDFELILFVFVSDVRISLAFL